MDNSPKVRSAQNPGWRRTPAAPCTSSLNNNNNDHNNNNSSNKYVCVYIYIYIYIYMYILVLHRHHPLALQGLLPLRLLPLQLRLHLVELLLFICLLSVHAFLADPLLLFYAHESEGASSHRTQTTYSFIYSRLHSRARRVSDGSTMHRLAGVMYLKAG